MDERAAQSRWPRVIGAFLAKLQRPGIHLGQMFLLWAAAVALVILVCALFFVPMYWLFS